MALVLHSVGRMVRQLHGRDMRRSAPMVPMPMPMRSLHESPIQQRSVSTAPGTRFRHSHALAGRVATREMVIPG